MVPRVLGVVPARNLQHGIGNPPNGIEELAVVLHRDGLGIDEEAAHPDGVPAVRTGEEATHPDGVPAVRTGEEATPSEGPPCGRLEARGVPNSK